MIDKWNEIIATYIRNLGKASVCAANETITRTNALIVVLDFICNMDEDEFDELKNDIYFFILAIDWKRAYIDEKIYSKITIINNRLNVYKRIKLVGLDQLEEIINDKQGVIIFGAGKYGIRMYQYFWAKKIPVTMMVGDAFANEISNLSIDVNVISEMDFEGNDGKIILIAAKSNYHLSMVASINERWKGDVFSISDKDFDRILQRDAFHSSYIISNLEILRKRIPPKTLTFIVDIVEHCNLNCQCCNHFSPLSDEYFMPFSEFSSDIRRLRNVMGEKISRVKIEGGEPLLHPEITRFILELRYVLPKCKIDLVTNGIMLEKMNEDFWNACLKSDVCIRPTKYPIKLDYEAMGNMVRDKGIQFAFFNDDKVQKTTFYEPLDLMGTQDKYESFHLCRKSNLGCADLKHGKLFACTFVANAHIFNKKFPEKQIKISDKDYINIYGNITEEDIFDFLCNPIPACRYCKVKEWIGGYPWATSSLEIQEWT